MFSHDIKRLFVVIVEGSHCIAWLAEKVNILELPQGVTIWICIVVVVTLAKIVIWNALPAICDILIVSLKFVHRCIDYALFAVSVVRSTPNLVTKWSKILRKWIAQFLRELSATLEQ